MKYLLPIIFSIFLFNSGFSQRYGGCDFVEVFIQNKEGDKIIVRSGDSIILHPGDTVLIYSKMDCQGGTVWGVWLDWKKDNSKYYPHFIGNSAAITSSGFYQVGEENRFLRFYVFEALPTKVEEVVHNLQFMVNTHPIPSSGNLEISSNLNLRIITIYNANGKEVYNEFVNGTKKKKIEILNVDPGMYFLRVEAENKKVETKVILFN